MGGAKGVAGQGSGAHEDAVVAGNERASRPAAETPAVGTRGRHVLVELHGCNGRRLDSVSCVVEALQAAARRIEATVVSQASHRYTPQGVTAILLIAESHLSVHTWPEEGYAAVDLYTCGQLDPRPAVEEIRKRLEAERCELWEVARGGQALTLRLSEKSNQH